MSRRARGGHDGAARRPCARAAARRDRRGPGYDAAWWWMLVAPAGGGRDRRGVHQSEIAGRGEITGRAWPGAKIRRMAGVPRRVPASRYLLADEAALHLDPELVLSGLMPDLGGKLPFGLAPLSPLDRVADPLPDRSRVLLARKGAEGSGDGKRCHGGPHRWRWRSS